jgi:2-hydroxy-3-keto-5-methylthiopentenyl-1-phosphate phosphatase
MREPGAVVFLDFDGTITRRDATDAILDAFADPAWLQIEDGWLSGRIGSRECLAAQMALVSATRQQVDRLLDEILVDPGLALLLDACRAHAVPVHVVSDGFDYCITRILGRPDSNFLTHLADSHIVSSSLRQEDGQWRTTFADPACAHGCATCKPAVMARLTAVGAVTVFVGDGLSDRYAAAHADIVFAKDTLATYCEHASIPYTPFDTLATVAHRIGHLSTCGKVFPAV